MSNKEFNPFPPNSGAARNWEHRFERLKLPNGELHAWHCCCVACDIIKKHAHSAYKIVVVDEPSDPLNLYPHDEPMFGG